MTCETDIGEQLIVSRCKNIVILRDDPGARKRNLMSDPQIKYAPGGPGIPPRWTSSAKTGAGTALNQHSKVWFTISHGILNEVYFPSVDQDFTGDMGFIVTRGGDVFSEEKRDCSFENL